METTGEPEVQGLLSPLSGAYLLIVVSEPLSEAHKARITNKLRQGLLSWDLTSCHVDLGEELDVISNFAPPGEESRGGERLIQFASEHLVTEVLIQPQLNTLQQCMRNMLASFTKHRHIIHAGYTFAMSGGWVLQDGSFNYNDLAYENSISINIHCYEEGEWTQTHIGKEQFSEYCRVQLNPSEVIQGTESIQKFLDYLDQFMTPQNIEQALPPSDVVGNIRFSHPTLYVFPGGQGDSALFGINGFNMLIDGGFSWKSCFWDFSRHLDRLDAILITRVSDENSGGVAALLQRKTMSSVYPQIGHVFANVPERIHSKNEENEESQDSLLIDVIDQGAGMLENLRILNLKPQVCLRDNNKIADPIQLYHKVGQGRLVMYVINPSKEAKELKEFMTRWNDNSKALGKFKSGINVDGRELWLPLANLVSICALLVWIPDNPEHTITRLLFPGSTPQNKVIKGLEKLKSLEFIQKPVVTPKSMSSGFGKMAESKLPNARKSASSVPVNNNMNNRLSRSRSKRRQETVSYALTESSVKSASTTTTATTMIHTGRPITEINRKELKKGKGDLDDHREKGDKDKQDKEKQDSIEKESIDEKKDILSNKEVKSDKSNLDSAERKRQRKEEKLRKAREEKNKQKEKRIATEKEKRIAAEKEKRIAAEKEKRIAAEKEKKKIQELKDKKDKEEKSRRLKKKLEEKELKEKQNLAENRQKVKKHSASKTNKEASNKTKKAADQKKIVPDVTKAGTKLEKISQLNDKEDSIVEKDQIEAMENLPIEDNDIEPELERIKDQEDPEDLIREPDIQETQQIVIQRSFDPIEISELQKVAPVDGHPNNLPLSKEIPTQPITYHHIKTPDEVDDLPEHEAVDPEIMSTPHEEEESKITNDQQEKEMWKSKNLLNEINEMGDHISKVNKGKNIITPESDGAQEQRELSEVILSATQMSNILDKSKIPMEQDEVDFVQCKSKLQKKTQEIVEKKERNILAKEDEKVIEKDIIQKEMKAPSTKETEMDKKQDVEESKEPTKTKQNVLEEENKKVSEKDNTKVETKALSTGATGMDEQKDMKESKEPVTDIECQIQYTKDLVDEKETEILEKQDEKRNGDS
ncbi:Microtubule-associated protein futsch,Electromotor neuron-associated protein 2 [Lepeophtheirus salmonis]|uniref:Microtubule-associated protein futsch,Electromotor neuron-associated protein 2 n=1 Tax=Lepeophtheirus salmonis TaxID=72036 RepID=A0A7R8CK65_LEPSM|nr:Microtubule-associated protein futsch,Electromotor neuron-associated protein 2 [Lepeophtheirus salmonis]CAF2847268.1 Microtubule-associated protein futsch,Electromotor neuron-associated protein 2 [Lepeophtheirus salmonis]